MTDLQRVIEREARVCYDDDFSEEHLALRGAFIRGAKRGIGEAIKLAKRKSEYHNQRAASAESSEKGFCHQVVAVAFNGLVSELEDALKETP